MIMAFPPKPTPLSDLTHLLAVSTRADVLIETNLRANLYSLGQCLDARRSEPLVGTVG